jgi:glycosyltransferase involved in cell wall biosynthesis
VPDGLVTGRVTVDGKHLALEGRPYRVRGVTYGSFAPRLDGELFPEPVQVKRDFETIAGAGLNAVRTYTLPPSDVLNLAEEYQLRMIIGLHYNDWRMEPLPGRAARRRIRDAGRRAVDDATERCAGRDAVLAIAVGNEVPVDIVRVHGIDAVGDGLSDLVARVHAADESQLATYVNYPTTEFLDVEGQDLACFNVFLEERDALRRYLRHLQVVAGSRPLLVTELGLASELHGEAAQADSLRWQLATVDETGCAGATVFAWTDDWAVAGTVVEGWGFGITDSERRPKPALNVATEWAHTTIGDRRESWPRVSVVVCAYNEEATIGECLESLTRCTYPELEVIVCDDGSTDGTVAIAHQYPFTVRELEHGGLSRARNAGLAAVTGEIVAYLDADATCHPEWPFHLAVSLEDADVVATGGPNLPFASAGFVERAVALSPGGPAEVLVGDDRAEHVPGCNMAYQKRVLEDIGGFDASYTAAGDDVDVCWKVLEEGHHIGFAAAAQVRHHRRTTVGRYLRQQRGYGRAERMLAGDHPHRFNRLGQARWRGFIYGGAAILPSLLRPVVYHGYMGGAPFQPVVRRRAEITNAWTSALLPLAAPVALAGLMLGLLSPWWLLLSAAAALAVLAYGAAVATAVQPIRGEPTPARIRMLVGVLHVLQPFWRTYGRLRGRPVRTEPPAQPEWTGDRWCWLHAIEEYLRARGCGVRSGGPSERWDLQVTIGPFLSARVTTAVMWQCEPRFAVAYRVRPSGCAIGAAAAALTLVYPWAGWTALALVVAAMLAERALLHRRTGEALRFTTAGVAS